MNKSYKTVWNESLGAYVAVGEDAPAAGRRASSTRRARRALPDIFVRPLSTAMALEERVVFDGAMLISAVDPWIDIQDDTHQIGRAHV